MTVTSKQKIVIYTLIVLFVVCVSCNSDPITIADDTIETVSDDDTQEEETPEEGEETEDDIQNEETGEEGEEPDNDSQDDETEGGGENEETDDATDETSECSDLIWSDEFEGATLDQSKWRYQRGTWNGSNVQNCYVDENTSVSQGTLKITAKYEPGFDCFDQSRDFTSGFVQTKDRMDWTYGYFEARVKVPASNSTWPAFWMSPQEDVYGVWPRSGEIDIFEIRGHDMTESSGNAHWGNSASDRRQEKGTFEFDDATQWHLYAVEWTEGELNFYIDDQWYHTINNFRDPNATEHPGPFNIGFYLRLNMAVGGDFLSEPHNDANNGIEQLPAVMEVDFVRVYSQKPGC